jgi:alkaline phosphatase D
MRGRCRQSTFVFVPQNISNMDTVMKTDNLLGPFIGNVTESSVKIWLHAPQLAKDESLSLIVTLHEGQPDAVEAARGSLLVTYENLNTSTLTFDALKPGTTYYYRLLSDVSDGAVAATAESGAPRQVELRGLTAKDLYFRTLPAGGYENQLDFLLMSCHNPDTAKDDGFQGFGVWAQIPEIIRSNENVRFAILAGDQAYGDEVEEQVLNEKDARRRQELYLGVYRKFWDNEHYRRVLCSLPAVSMWDDHDITDGWGSRLDSFDDKNPHEFKAQWRDLFEAASSVFKQMQAARNPDPLSPDYKDGLDFCFKVGGAGFVVADLRSNRNVSEQRIWKPEQLENIRRWVEANNQNLHTLFFVSTVVFSHGAPQIEQRILRSWFVVLDVMGWFGKFKIFRRPARWFDHTVGDLRDDINDSWGAEVNDNETQRVLDFLFGLQNSPGGLNGKGIKVVILSGDIHTPGYSTLYSDDPNHKNASIPHVVASPVAYQPFSWIGEAIFRHLTRVVELGVKKDEQGNKIKPKYTAQVSHHFCYRNVVVVSLRNYEQDESHLKVKYYLEGFPEPQVVLFDLNHGSRREAINWSAQAKENAEMPNLVP